MKAVHFVALVAALALVSAVVAVVFVGRPAPSLQEPLVSAGNVPEEPRVTAPAGTPPTPATQPDAPAMTPKGDAPDAEPAEDLWQIVGQMESPSPGLDFFGLASPERNIAAVYRVNPADPDAIVRSTHLPIDHRGRFSALLNESELPEPGPAACLWEVRIHWYPEPGLLQSWADRTPRPDVATLKGLVTPTVRGRVIDLGVIRPVVDGDHWIATGRLVTQGGLPIHTANQHELLATAPEQYFEFSFATNTEGRFAVHVYLEGQHATAWSLMPSFGVADSGEDRLSLPAPAVRGRVLDFGDISLPGVVIEIRAALRGHEAAKPDADPYVSGEDLRGEAPFVEIEFNGHGTSDAEVMFLLSAGTGRIVVLEGRYDWGARLEGPDSFVAPQSGVLLARPDVVNVVHIEFAPVATIPLLVLDAQGAPAQSYDARFTIELESGRWRETRPGATAVPVLPGLETEIYVSTGRRSSGARADGTARLGDTEVVLRLVETADPARTELLIVLPALPPGTGLDELPVVLNVFDDSSNTTVRKELRPGPHSESVTTRVKGGQEWLIELRGGEALGYRGGVLCPPLRVAVPESGTFRVEMPALPSPPWTLRAQTVNADLRAGASPVGLRGRWRKGNLERSDTIRDGETLSDQSNLKSGEGRVYPELLPSALILPDREIPLESVPPQTDWGTAYLRLHLPARVRVKVTRNGEPAGHCSVRLDSAAGVSCTAELADGTGELWAPPGPAIVAISISGHELHKREIVVPAERVLDVEFSTSLVRVEFRQAGEDHDDIVWQLSRASGGSLHFVEYLTDDDVLLLEAGKYRLIPDAPYDPRDAFDLDLSAGKDRKCDLPALTAMEQVSILLKLPQDVVVKLDSAEIHYYLAQPAAGESSSWTYAASWVSPEVRFVPDGIRVDGLPRDQRLLLRGMVALKATGKEPTPFFFPAIEVQAREGAAIDLRLLKARTAGWSSGPTLLATTSERGGCWFPLALEDAVAVGSHEVIALDEKFNRRLSLTLVIPPGEGPLEMPAALREALKQAGLPGGEEDTKQGE